MQPKDGRDFLDAGPRLREDLQRSRKLANHAVERARRLAEEAIATRHLLETRMRAAHEVTSLEASVWDAAATTIARANMERDQQLATVAHELRQPLAAAIAAERVMAVSDDAEMAARARGILGRQLHHLSELVETLLEYSRLNLAGPVARHEAIDANDIVATAVEAVEAAALERHHSIVVSPSSEPAWILGDPSQLRQAVVNLLQNAIRYTPNNGRIDVVVGADGDETSIEVRDTGDGIPADRLAEVFQPFVRLSGAGAGLGIGLALVRRIAERHGGRITADSEGPGRGSRFRLSLPHEEARADAR